jgi:hypothetical protein
MPGETLESVARPGEAGGAWSCRPRLPGWGQVRVRSGEVGAGGRRYGAAVARVRSSSGGEGAGTGGDAACCRASGSFVIEERLIREGAHGRAAGSGGAVVRSASSGWSGERNMPWGRAGGLGCVRRKVGPDGRAAGLGFIRCENRAGPACWLGSFGALACVRLGEWVRCRGKARPRRLIVSKFLTMSSASV